MNIPVSLPVDNDGFLRRECPDCLRQFKRHVGPANEEAEHQGSVESLFCPFCGLGASLDQWATTEQVKYAQEVAEPAAMKLINDELDAMFRGLNSKHVKVKKSGDLSIPAEPDPLIEPDDMTIVASPCHGWEPMKVPDETVGSLHCVVCGQAFALLQYRLICWGCSGV